MSPLRAKEVALLAEIAETKRVFGAIENSLLKSTPACLVVTSAEPGEGKTTLVAGLAAIAARQTDKRVLAIDLNWHSPALHSPFGLELTFDAQAVSKKTSVVDLAVPSGLKHLDVLTAVKSPHHEGPLNGDTSALGAEIVRQARGIYDFVVVDTSSIFRTNRNMMDPVSISKAADGTAMVVLANVTPRQRVKRARMVLETGGANVLGAIVNQWKNEIA